MRGRRNVWWVVHPHSRQVIAAYEEPRFGQLRELPLTLCFDLWGDSPPSESEFVEPFRVMGEPRAPGRRAPPSRAPCR